jgi:hypothetical protein
VGDLRHKAPVDCNKLFTESIKAAATKCLPLCEGISGTIGALIIDPTYQQDEIDIPIDALVLDLATINEKEDWGTVLEEFLPIKSVHFYESPLGGKSHHTPESNIRQAAAMVEDIIWASCVDLSPTMSPMQQVITPSPSEIDKNLSWLVPDVQKGEHLLLLPAGTKIEILPPKLHQVKAIINKMMLPDEMNDSSAVVHSLFTSTAGQSGLSCSLQIYRPSPHTDCSMIVSFLVDCGDANACLEQIFGIRDVHYPDYVMDV